MKRNDISPKVSVIVPCYGVEKYLDRCVNSLVNQSLQDIEIILVDDGSPDRVPEMCDSWAAKDNRVKVIHKQNEGLGYARNSGLQIATGEYVTFVDSDDYVCTDTYKAVYEEAQKECACAVFFGINKEYKKGKWAFQGVKTRQMWKDEQITDYMLDMVACAPCKKEERKWVMSVCHGIYLHSIIEENNLRFLSEREYLFEDFLFNVDFLGYADKIVHLPQMFYYYCLNTQSLTATFQVDKYERFLCLHSFLIQKIGQREGAILRIDRLFIGFARKYILALVTSHHDRKKEILNKILYDRNWDELKVRYNPDWLPPYQNVFYRLILQKYTRLLMCYAYMASTIRHLLVKER